MKQVNKTKEAIILLTLLLPFIYAFSVWNKLPENVPTHFNLKGEPDDYSSKSLALLLLPVINIIIYLILFLYLELIRGKRIIQHSEVRTRTYGY